jgi:hypothetical protein
VSINFLWQFEIILKQNVPYFPDLRQSVLLCCVKDEALFKMCLLLWYSIRRDICLSVVLYSEYMVI